MGNNKNGFKKRKRIWDLIEIFIVQEAKKKLVHAKGKRTFAETKNEQLAWNIANVWISSKWKRNSSLKKESNNDSFTATTQITVRIQIQINRIFLRIFSLCWISTIFLCKQHFNKNKNFFYLQIHIKLNNLVDLITVARRSFFACCCASNTNVTCMCDE